MPGFILNGLLKEEKSFGYKMSNGILKGIIKNPVKGWSLRRGLFVHGVSTPKEYVLLTKQYSIKDGIGQIRCPSLICEAENDEIAAFASTVYDQLSCPKTYLKFTAYEGAGEHCEDGNRSIFNQRVFDWLDELYQKAQ